MPDWIWAALALVMIIEGIGPLLMPNKWRAYLQQVAQSEPNQLRQMGGTLVVIGSVCLYFIVN
ncbi:DUF2065 domain-containing protein [Alteromonas lipolytica]|uniref:DUF2065 domain-containing protein n=1 Tax=Alteromonas lipolytica TaxID=1856405 RepID=A0A1E8F935_9ALTE|nr:DUF2065 domain-containing protein [Alteromonas lipolytica]OFI32427.1 DUF2065 domain-containing protein [Alteromonas lipolytica]GGF79776.1 hypothetical protein GCM10011338_35140 [Alteromonas lipolytica]